MAFSTGNDSGGPMAEINVTPLVDVMLVLLIIFMITAPLMSHKVKVELPQATLNHIVTVDWYYVDALERALRKQHPNPQPGRFFDPEEPFAGLRPLGVAPFY